MAKSAKKPAAKKPAAKKPAAKKPAANALGCCTITGLDGPNKVYPRVTKAKCQQLAHDLDGNPQWYAGDCA